MQPPQRLQFPGPPPWETDAKSQHFLSKMVYRYLWQSVATGGVLTFIGGFWCARVFPSASPEALGFGGVTLAVFITSVAINFVWSLISHIRVRQKHERRVQDFLHELKRRQRTYDRKFRQLDYVYELSQTNEEFIIDFIKDTKARLKTCHTVLRRYVANKANNEEFIDAISREFHSVKGVAALLSLQIFAESLHNAEDRLKIIVGSSERYSRGQLAAVLRLVRSLSVELKQYERLAKLFTSRPKGSETKSEASRLAQAVDRLTGSIRKPNFNIQELTWLKWEIEQSIASLSQADLNDFVPRYQILIQEVAQRAAKSLEPGEFQLAQVGLKKHVANRISDMLVHCLKNAVDHGIEPPESRTAKHKPIKGHISVRMERVGESVQVKIKDDGRGINPEVIAKKALSLGIVKEDQLSSMTTQQKVNLIFYPGFSTAPAVTEHSGRGVGMDAVASMANELGGGIQIRSEVDQGTEIVIEVPSEVKQYVTALSICPLGKILSEVCEEYRTVFSNRGITLNTPKVENEQYVFADQMLLKESMRNVLRSLIHYELPSKSVHMELQSFLGKRQFDSYEVIRIGLIAKEESRDGVLSLAKIPELLPLHQGLASFNGTAFRLANGRIEINIPSNMPVKFRSFPIGVTLLGEDLRGLADVIPGFFQEKLAGWPCEVKPVERTQTVSVSDITGVVIMNEADFDAYRDRYSDPEKAGNTANMVVVMPKEEQSGRNPLPDEVIAVEGPLDPAKIAQIMERCLLRIFTRKALKSA